LRIFKLTMLAILVLFVGASLHYNLPDREVVRITGTEVIRVDPTRLNRMFYGAPDTGNASVASRDVRFINAVDEDRRARVFRNQDTGFWPPYLKFDSGNLQAEAADFDSDVTPEWVAVRHYGWRIPWLSIYPNALSIRPVEGPDATLIPWFNIVFLTVLLAVVWAIGVRVLRWRRRVAGEIGEAWEDAGDDLARRRRGIRDWFRRR
jgi:hypothetical protein